MNYNLLGDVLLSDTGLDTVPEQIRAALHKKRLRVTDLFHQLDDDQSGTISCKEFEKALKEFSLRGPQGGPVDKESVQAVLLHRSSAVGERVLVLFGVLWYGGSEQ